MVDCYIVRVQDIGEVYNYAYHTLEEAQHLMEIENLPYSLWVRKANGEEEELPVAGCQFEANAIC